MRIRILTISERQPDWVNQAFAEYARRLPRYLAPELIELPLARRRDDVARAKSEEGERLLAAMPKSSHVVALDERGTDWSSVQLAEQLGRWQQLGTDIALLIGGPDGLASEVLAAARQRWSLSKLTLPHGMVRVLLAEQLYRAHSILEGHPYHRA
jgi:23S rRNA (pseudouridine1915-N3)-methyltransferase